MEKALLCFTKNYANFSSRAQRSEYWFYVLIILIANIILGITDATAGTYSPETNMGLLGSIFSLATIIPGIAVTVRRLHDIDKTGWWLLIGLIPFIGAIWLLVLECLKGTDGENRFGTDPLQG